MKIITITITIVLALHCVQTESQNDPRINILKKDSVVHNYENITRIEEILELFSVGVIGSQWTKIYKRLSTVCAENMMQYLNGLEQKEIWAIKSKLLFKCDYQLMFYKQAQKRVKMNSYSRLVQKFHFSFNLNKKRGLITTCSAYTLIKLSESVKWTVKIFENSTDFDFKTVSHDYIKMTHGFLLFFVFFIFKSSETTILRAHFECLTLRTANIIVCNK